MRFVESAFKILMDALSPLPNWRAVPSGALYSPPASHIPERYMTYFDGNKKRMI